MTAVHALPLFLAQEAEGGPNLLVIMVAVLAIFWVIVILPERKERKRKQALIDSIQKNDKVLLTSGIYASVAAVGEKDVTVKFDDGQTRVRVVKSSIATVLDKDGEAPADGKS